jgi:hypothetical protein
MYNTLAPVLAHKYDTSLNNLLGTNILAYFDTFRDKEKYIVTLTLEQG